MADSLRDPAENFEDIHYREREKWVACVGGPGESYRDGVFKHFDRRTGPLVDDVVRVARNVLNECEAVGGEPDSDVLVSRGDINELADVLRKLDEEAWNAR